MILALLLAAVAAAALLYVGMLLRIAVERSALVPRAEGLLIGAITNFFDTLGIGSFAPTTAWLKLRKLAPDRVIPPTMLAGHMPPTLLQSGIFLLLLGVQVDPVLLLASIVAMVAGGLFGARLCERTPVRAIQLIVATALLVAAFFYALSNLGLMPIGGTATRLDGALFTIAILAQFGFGILLNFGVGNYAPTLAMLSLMGFDPRLAFPIMASAGAMAGTAAGVRIVRRPDLDHRLVVGIALGGLPAVLVAAFLVKELPVETLRWLVVVVVVYAALLLINAALRGPRPESREELIAAALD